MGQGRDLPTILILLLITFCLNTNPVTSNEACSSFFDSNPQSMESQFWGGYFSQFLTRDGDYELRNVIKFNVIGAVEESSNTTALCVGFHDTTSYTKNIRNGSNHAVAWATMNVDPNMPTGIVKVDSKCWAQKRDMTACNPVFLPMPGILDTALYVHSPLSVEFWTVLQDKHLFAKDWVKKMNFQSNGEKFPSSWVSNLQISSLESLEIKGNDWRRPQTLLSPLESLKRLDLTDNNIQELPRDIFVNTPRLQDLLLARNSLSVFPQGLEALNELKLLDITNPKGSAELIISESELSTIKQVQIFGLENVNLYTNITMLLSLAKLLFLNLSGCGISDIDDIKPEIGILGRHESLLILDLSNNNLEILPPTLFSTFTNLRSLALQKNMFESCPVESLKHLTNLERLDLSKNIISNVSHFCFTELHKKLEYLDLSHNKISYLSENTFRNLSSLKTLKLCNNKLSSIFPASFLGLLKLRNLDLSHNEIEPEIDLQLSSIDELNLSNNRLLNIKRISDTTIKSLDVSRNNISELKMFYSVSHLNLSYNAISKISEDMLAYFNNISGVDLGENPFDCCDKNLNIFKDWLKTTHVDIKNLGTKHLLKCFVPGENQNYSIRSFVYERELCKSINNSIAISSITSEGWNMNIFFIVVGVLSAVIFMLAISLFYTLYLYQNRKISLKTNNVP